MSRKRPKLPGTAVDRVSTTYHYLWGKNKTANREKEAKELNRDVRDTLVPQETRQEMADILRSTSELKLSVGRISEASIRIRENVYLVTARGSWFHLLTEEDLVLATNERESLIDISQIPKYWDWHLGIYQAYDQINAIFLGQPAYVMAVSNEDNLPDKELMPFVSDLIGHIKMSNPDPENISRDAEDGKIIIIPGKGVLSLGETLVQSVTNLDLVNRWFEIAHLASN